MIQTHRRAALRLTVLLLVVLAAVLVLAAAALASEPSPSASADQVVLKIGWTVEPDTLNPFIGWQNQDYEIWSINYSFLFGFGVSDKPTLDLAAEYPTKENGGLSADGKVWTIKLRPGVKWSDGEPLTADDVAFTYNYIVKNEMFNMALATRGILGAEALDPTTVQITCARPKADMMKIFIPILPEHVWSEVTPKDAETSFTNPVPIVGSGPFFTSEFVKGKFLRMERNPYYYGTTPTVDEIIFATYQNPDTMTIDYKSGNLDAAWGIPVAQFRTLESEAGTEALAYPYYNWEYLNFNCFDSPDSLGAPVLKDWRFRNALNYAIDRAKLCAIAFQDYAAPGTTIVPPKTWKDPDYHWQPSADEEMGFDLAEAGRLLDEAGYPLKDGKRVDTKGKPITLRLYATSDNVPSQTEGKLITGWLQELGFKIEFSVLDAGALSARVWNFEGDAYRPDFDMYIDSWLGYVDPGQTLTARHDLADRRHQRTLLVQRRVRQARRRAGGAARPGGAPAVHLADAADHVRADAVGGRRLPGLLRGLRHRGLDGLDARQRRQRPGVLHRRQRRHLRQPEAGRGDRCRRGGRRARPRGSSWR